VAQQKMSVRCGVVRCVVAWPGVPGGGSECTGFLEPSSGTALIEGLDIRKDMDSIYSIMGVCPQHE